MDPSFHRSLADRADDLFEAMKMTDHGKKTVTLQVRSDDTQYWAIRQIPTDLYPYDGDHELRPWASATGPAQRRLTAETELRR